MSPQDSIEVRLFEEVRDLPLFAASAKAWPNVAFDPPDGETYLRVDHLPNTIERLFVKGSDPSLYRGILQLTVVAPLNGGASAATGLAGEVAGYFPADLALMTWDSMKIRIERAPDVAPAFRNGHAWMVPVSVRYEVLGGAPEVDLILDAIDAVHVAVVGMLGEA